MTTPLAGPSEKRPSYAHVANKGDDLFIRCKNHPIESIEDSSLSALIKFENSVIKQLISTLKNDVI